ncbi:glycoside hydrolase family 43 protein [Asticcacaulis taihuensis]|uniref:family 43 glycosylhydrolase n=1 Tax=Asticcacaulis taihuensis TaxID=260084 RepID=UPI0026E9EB44|nr:glycoside hydrolase 43 family protein [Asticcacaulis taihuensis]
MMKTISVESLLKAVLIGSTALGASLLITATGANAAGKEAALSTETWTADNGDGSYTNPIFYDEFSDPDVIKVGDWFYLTGTTMHTMPGLPVLRSKDLVNWEFLSYAVDKLDLGPEYRLEGGNIYGRGIWAPSFRYHNGTFYIFSNVNGRMTQIFTATDPRGPWTHREMKRSLHDLSVLFDDDGKAYVVWDYQAMHIAQLTDDLTDIVPGTEKVLFDKDAGMGEGAHFYKFDGKYYILSANYAGQMRMSAARADSVYGPYEVNRSISQGEDYGLVRGYRLNGKPPPFVLSPPDPSVRESLSLHQGGIVQTDKGEWWGMSMMDSNSIGRLVNLSPVTWKDGWPYFGLPGNLGRTPRTWQKPRVDTPQPVKVPFERSDSFDRATLKPIWQWNHVPVDGQWSLAERPGFLRLHTLPAKSFWEARNSLTQRAIGPQSEPTVSLDGAHLQTGDTAGLALLNYPYAWIGLEKTAEGLNLTVFDQTSGQYTRIKAPAAQILLRADCDFMTEKARFSYSVDGKTFTPLGDPFTMVFQLTTFQGVRFALFSFNDQGKAGGYADFDRFDLYQKHPHGTMKPIPYKSRIQLTSLGSGKGLGVKDNALAAGASGEFDVLNMGTGRVALQTGDRFVSVNGSGQVSLKKGPPGPGETFQWIETLTGELTLMSLANDRFLRIDPATLQVIADSAGPLPDGTDGVRFGWHKASGNGGGGR